MLPQFPQFAVAINKKSAEAAGEVTTYVDIGAGVYEILIMNIYSPNKYAQECHLGFDRRLPDGTRLYFKLKSGHVNYENPFCLDNTRIVEGPGRLYSHVYHLETTTHILQLLYRRVR